MLEIQNVARVFGGLVALDNVVMTVKEGEIRGLIGPNGSGKTTLINVISGFYVPSTGKVLFKTSDISGKTPYNINKFGLARTFQNINLFPDMSAIENVTTAYSMYITSNLFSVVLNLPSFRREEKKALEKAEEILEFVGLKGKEDFLAKNLPYGQQRLLEIARALATDPSLILLDEPVAGMNEQESAETAELVRKLQANGKTILLIEHHMRFVMDLCDRITVLNSGSVIAEGCPEEIQNNQKVIEVYLGKRGNKNAQN